MAGLTREGFTPLSYGEIVTRIGSRLEAFSPGIDLSSEAPDGFMVEVFSLEIAQAWSELNLVYNSYNPNEAIGAGLRNIGDLSGLPFGAATRSQSLITLVGTAGTTVPRGSVVSDDAGNEFLTNFDAVIPANVQVIASTSGPINVDIGAIKNIVSNVDGWTSIVQSNAGRAGAAPQTENQYRNLRNKTVMRNFVAVESVIRARLLETLGIEQVVVLNNDDPVTPLPDGTPPNTIHVTVGEVAVGITDENIAQVILQTKGLGCPTFGSTTVTVNDDQGNPHAVSFSKAVAMNVLMNVEILFLDADYAGSEELIRANLVSHINSLATDEDVIWSRLFELITPYSKAQVNVLELSKDGVNYSPANLAVGAGEFANTTPGSINITVVN